MKSLRYDDEQDNINILKRSKEIERKIDNPEQSDIEFILYIYIYTKR